MKSYILLSLVLGLILVSCKLLEDETDNGTNPVDPTIPTITITSPNSGDSLMVASAFEITWTLNATNAVNIEYTADNGSSWNVIAKNQENDGSYVWDPVPNTVSSQCRIRIVTTDSVSSATSAGFFSIYKSTQKSLRLLDPNGGEIIFSGSSYLIKWAASAVTSIRLEFSENGGTTWNDIVANYPADSSKFLWASVPNVTSQGCFVRISEVSDPTFFDASDKAFTITTPQLITVSEPNGGESWTGNSLQTIKWVSSGVDSVSIEYTTNNGVSWNLITAETPSDGYYTWDPIPNTPASNCKIRVTDSKDGFPVDESDNVFSITPESALIITAPNGGENLLSGSSFYIKWQTSDANRPQKNLKKKTAKISSERNFNSSLQSPNSILSVTNVKLEYTTDGGSNWISITETTPNDGEFLWNPIPSHNSSLCRVRLSDVEDKVPFDISDASFTIYNQISQELIVTSPNGDEVWPAGTSQNITWTAYGVTSVDIEYTTNNGLSWSTIVTNTPSDGFYTWAQVPNTASTNCRIRIKDAVDGTPMDESNSMFTISPEPEITIVSPNGGESWIAGGSSSIKWTSTNIANVKLEYTTNNGAEWVSIVQSIPSVGVYNWTTIPDVNSSLCRIRISDADDGSPSDISDNNFIITNQITQSITLLSPNGGEVWQSGTFQSINWEANAINEIKIEYTTNNGIQWIELIDNLPSSGSFGWSPIPELNSTQCKVRISDASDGEPADESDAVFVIKPSPSLSVVFPNGGETFTAGQPIQVRWNSQGVENVTIEYTINNGTLPDDWFVLIPSTPSDGLFETGFSIPSDKYRIRIKEAVNGSPVDESDGTFTVKPQITKSVSVISPNGGENWLSNTTVEIRWVSTNLPKVKLEYTVNNGADWFVIADSVVSNGIYNWGPVPVHNSDICRVRISDPYDENISDETDGFFSIHPQEPLLRWVFPNGGEYIYRDFDSDPPNLDTLITWISTGIDQVNIEYTDDNGQNWYPIVSNYQSTGAYNWLIPDGQPSTLARIRIYAANDPNVTDMSDSYFNLRIAPGVNFKNLTGDDLWNANSPQKIKWTGSQDVKTVNLMYSADNGKSWQNIATGLNNDHNKVNQFNWNMPKNMSAGSILIKISSGKYSQVSKAIKVIK